MSASDGAFSVSSGRIIRASSGQVVRARARALLQRLEFGFVKIHRKCQASGWFASRFYYSFGTPHSFCRRAQAKVVLLAKMSALVFFHLLLCAPHSRDLICTLLGISRTRTLLISPLLFSYLFDRTRVRGLHSILGLRNDSRVVTF